MKLVSLKGCNINIKNKKGETPEGIASKVSHFI